MESFTVESSFRVFPRKYKQPHPSKSNIFDENCSRADSDAMSRQLAWKPCLLSESLGNSSRIFCVLAEAGAGFGVTRAASESQSGAAGCREPFNMSDAVDKNSSNEALPRTDAHLHEAWNASRLAKDNQASSV